MSQEQDAKKVDLNEAAENISDVYFVMSELQGLITRADQKGNILGVLALSGAGLVTASFGTDKQKDASLWTWAPTIFGLVALALLVTAAVFVFAVVMPRTVGDRKANVDSECCELGRADARNRFSYLTIAASDDEYFDQLKKTELRKEGWHQARVLSKILVRKHEYLARAAKVFAVALIFAAVHLLGHQFV